MLDTSPKHISLDLSGVTKVYPGVVALKNVALSISGGEVVGLIGENGAGKSTLMKILGGAVYPDFGTIKIDGAAFRGLSTIEATNHGIAFVHQELNPFANLDVAGNILLGREISVGPFKVLDKQSMADHVQPILDLLGTRFGPHDSVADLSLADQQLLEIAKALSMNARLVIMDEPTSSLTLSETRRLLEVIDQLKARGVAILFVSHRLAEIEQIADRVIVLRDGANVGELVGDDIEKDNMVRMMIGRDVEQFYEKTDHSAGVPALEFVELKTKTFPDQAVTLTIHAGEIVGLAGLVGAGRTDLAHTAFGVEPAIGGEVRVYGVTLDTRSTLDALAAGLCLVPENRKEQGLFLDFAISENIALPNMDAVSSRGWVSARRVLDLASRFQKQLSIKAASLSRSAAELSGGNQQKVVLAKWLAMDPKVIILDEPTRGIDVGAKAEVYHLMQALARRGIAILMISSDMEEVIGISDRVAVMHRGKVTGTLNADELTEENILRLAVG